MSRFYEISPKLIGGTYLDPKSTKRVRHVIPVVSLREARPPFVVCVALDSTGGSLEATLRATGLKHGRDYLHAL